MFQKQHGLVEPCDSGGELRPARHSLLRSPQHPQVLWDRAGETKVLQIIFLCLKHLQVLRARTGLKTIQMI